MTAAAKDNQQFYRLCFRDIVAGFAVFSIGEKDYYAKHFSQLDLAELDDLSKLFEREAAKKGLQTEKQKLKFLDETENWTKKEEARFLKIQEEIKYNDRKIAKIMLKSQKAGFEKDNKELKKEYQKLSGERFSLLGMTIESYAERKKQEESFRRSLFLDINFKEAAFSKEEYENMEDSDYSALISNYNFFMLKFSEENLKRIAASSFFLNLFFLSRDSAYEFFGKRVADLTMFQEFIFSKALFYKSILTHPDKKVPDSYAEDIDKFVNWLESANNSMSSSKNSVTEGKDTVASGLVGATKEELENYASSRGARVVNLGQEVAKLKKELGKDNLDMKDVLRLHDRLGI